MKKIIILIFSTLLILGVDAQHDIYNNIIEKNYSASSINLGQDITIKKSILKVDDSKVSKVFEVHSEESGEYYLNVWMTSSEKNSFDSGVFTEYELVVNNIQQDVKLKPEQKTWHNARYQCVETNERIKVILQVGVNYITFSCDAPIAPEVDFIRLSKTIDDVDISETKFAQFIDDIQSKITARLSPNSIATVDTLSLLNAITLNTTLSNPSGNYQHCMSVNVEYTTYKIFFYSAGEQVSFVTYAADGFEHVLEVFNSSDPESNSWVCRSSTSTGVASLSVSIPTTGFYYIRLRSYRQTEEGLVDLSVNSSYFYSNCPVTSNGFAHYGSTDSATYNYFTAKLSDDVDTYLWLESTGIPGKIVAFNNDYSGDGDFDWGTSSRIIEDYTSNIYGMLVSACSSYDPEGTCNIYGKCMNSTVSSYFPNLKDDDAIQSAPYSSLYNCISWSGGIVDYWEWPCQSYSDYYVSGNDLSCFDKFYSTERYTDAVKYIRTFATYSTSVVDLWALEGEYTHASVTDPGNDHPHGYDWESKPGTLMRTFHPRNALSGSSYGVVTNYYKPISYAAITMTLSESIARGLSVIENVEYTESENNKITELLNILTTSENDILNEKYVSWKVTWTNSGLEIYSNPRMYAKSEEYEDFIEYCEYLGMKSWAFIFDKFDEADFFVINALEDLTLADNASILDGIKEQNSIQAISSTGAAIVRSPRINAMKYIKELLSLLDYESDLNYEGNISLQQIGVNNENEDIVLDDGITYSNSFDFSVYPNPCDETSCISFVLSSEANVSVEVVDLMGKVISIPLSNKHLSEGDYNIQLNIPTYFRGSCLVRLLVNNNVNVKLLINK